MYIYYYYLCAIMVTITTNNGIVTIDTGTTRQECSINAVAAQVTETGMKLFPADESVKEFRLSDGIAINGLMVEETTLIEQLTDAGLIKPLHTLNLCNRWQYPSDWYNLYDVIAADVPPTGYKRACSWLITNGGIYSGEIPNDWVSNDGGVSPIFGDRIEVAIYNNSRSNISDLSLYASAAVSDTLIRTSDGYLGLPIIHRWNLAKDKINSEGWATRWIVVYVPIETTRYAIPSTKLADGEFLPVKGLIIGQIENTNSTIFGEGALTSAVNNAEIEFLDYEEGARSNISVGQGKNTIKRWRGAPEIIPDGVNQGYHNMQTCVELHIPENTPQVYGTAGFSYLYNLRYLKIPLSCTRIGNVTGTLPALRIIDIERGWINTLNCTFAWSYFVTIEAWVDFFHKLGVVTTPVTLTIPVNTLAAMTNDQISIATDKGWTIAGA